MKCSRCDRCVYRVNDNCTKSKHIHKCVDRNPYGQCNHFKIELTKETPHENE